MEDIQKFDVIGIQECQCNRYPMLFIDRVTECLPLKYAKGYKLFSYNEWFFHGYDIPSPKVWGVVLVESMAQMFLMTILSTGESKGEIAISKNYRKIQYFKKVEPGDRLDIEATCDSFRRGVAQGKVVGRVCGEPVCSMECTIVVPIVMGQFSVKSETAKTDTSDYVIEIAPDAVSFGIEDIQKCMLNKYPGAYLDKVLDVKPGKSIHAIKNFTYNEWFFPVHFSDDPSVPGFVQIETCMQCFLLTFLSMDEYKRMETSDRLIDNVKLNRKVIPGDTLELKATLDKFRRGVGTGRVESFVGGEPACSFDVTACIPAILDNFKPMAKK